MRASLVRWLNDRRALGWDGAVSGDARVMAQLAKLGYTTDDEAGGVYVILFDQSFECEFCAFYR